MILDYVAKEDQLKIEADDWSTYWDEETNCWMMAEHVTVRCFECRGRGETCYNDEGCTDDELEICGICGGTGQDLIDIKWDDAISCEDYQSLVRQRWYLNKRYGTHKVKTVTDYWLKTH